VLDLSDFQKTSSGFDIKDNFKDGLQGRSKVKRSPKRQRKKLGAGHGRATPHTAVLQQQEGRTVRPTTTHGCAWARA